MTAQVLLQDLLQQGFSLEPQGDGIKVRPASALTAELREAIRASKAELLNLLTTDACPTCGGVLVVERGMAGDIATARHASATLTAGTAWRTGRRSKA
jgi:hypothetical protein